MTEELLKLQTYGRLFQRLASTKRLVPLGIYRTVPVTSCPEITVRETDHCVPGLHALHRVKPGNEAVVWIMGMRLQFMFAVLFSGIAV